MTPRALLAGGLFGFGFSGLIDTLLLHLVFQWHHLLSGVSRTDTLDGLRTNVLADGLFSIAMLVVAGIGAGLLWRAERRTDVPLAIRPIAGAAVLGLGAFDLYDALVDHVLLGLHQPLSQGGRYNPHWIVVSVLVLLAGAYLYGTGTRSGRETDREYTDARSTVCPLVATWSAPSSSAGPLLRGVGHGGTASSSIPGWTVLIGGVLGLRIVVGAGVVAVDRPSERPWNR